MNGYISNLAVDAIFFALDKNGDGVLNGNEAHGLFKNFGFGYQKAFDEGFNVGYQQAHRERLINQSLNYPTYGLYAPPSISPSYRHKPNHGRF